MKYCLVLTVIAVMLAQGAMAETVNAKKFDTSLPVEIASDSLEVLQHENKAIFRGNVIAVQGQVRLTADIMTVHYKQKGDAASSVAPTSAAPAGKSPPSGESKVPAEMGAVTRIEVEGNVLMATTEESAKGDKGDYDVPTRILRLSGKNVVLTRGKNIMRGTALEYNMETGRSILTHTSDGMNGKPTGTRVRGVFVPNKEPAKILSKEPSVPAEAKPAS